MKKVGIREVQINLIAYLKSLPFTITRYGKPIARVIDVIEDERKRTIIIKTKKEAKKAVNVPGFCEHGCRADLCVHKKCREKAEKYRRI